MIGVNLFTPIIEQHNTSRSEVFDHSCESPDRADQPVLHSTTVREYEYVSLSRVLKQT